MYLMYIDESGDTSTLEQGGSRVLVVSGCIIDEKDKQDIEARLREIKRKYYRDADIEIKSNFLRYANPSITDPNKSSPIKLYDQGQYDALQYDVQEFLKTIPITLITSVIDKKGYWAKYPAQNPYEVAYIFLLERFQTFLNYKDLFCYPIYNVFQYNKKVGEYDWFDNILKPRLYYHTTVIASLRSRIGPQIDGTGLKFFPKETKKDFRFYE